MREFGQEVTPRISEVPLSFSQQIRFNAIIGLVAGILFGSLEYVFGKYVYKRMSFGRTLLIGALSYLLTVILLASFGIRAFTKIIGRGVDWETYKGYILSKEMILLVFYCFLIGFFIDLFREINKKFGPGNLWKMLKGEFYSPKEEQRIFMFLDLKNSTGIAEQLGHNKYSRLIQDCFQDVSDVVLTYKANIYQYVGDEIVLTWTINEGLQHLNCIRFFFAYKEKLKHKVSFYKKKYGLMPSFKAGMEMGPVMVAEVGDLKREIAYHGDVLNTASRIQGFCNTYGKSILISENLEQALKESLRDKTELLGDIQLRGKQKNVKIYSVELV